MTEYLCHIQNNAAPIITVKSPNYKKLESIYNQKFKNVRHNKTTIIKISNLGLCFFNFILGIVVSVTLHIQKDVCNTKLKYIVFREDELIVFCEDDLIQSCNDI